MNKSILILILITILAGFLRLYRLSSVPNGLEQDETSIGYNAYSILMTQKDEYGKTFPGTFKAFGEYKLPGYIYITSISILFFGLTEFGVRFPSAFFGILTIISLFCLVRTLFHKTDQKEIYALGSAFLLSINPWHIHFSRGAFEVTLALFFLTTGAALMLIALEQKKYWLVAFALLFFSCAAYTYNITRILAPFMICFFLWQYRETVKKIPRITKLIFFTIVTLLFLPFILSMTSPGGFHAAKGTLIFSSNAVLAPILEFRSYMINIPTLISKLLFNNIVLIVWQYFYNILSYLSVSFLFLTGSTHGNHGIGTEGQFYIFELPFMLYGIGVLFQKYRKEFSMLFFWFLSTIVLASATREAPQATRSFFIIIPLIIMSATGSIHLYQYLISSRATLSKFTIFLLFGILPLYAISHYFFSYTQRFPIYYARPWRAADKSLSLYIKEHEQEYETIVFDTRAGFIYTSYLFYTAYSPHSFYESVKRAPDTKEGFSEILSFGKYQFHQIDWSIDYKKGRMLIITTNDLKPKDIPAKMTFYFPKRPIVQSIQEEIMQFPTEEIAYVAVSTNK